VSTEQHRATPRIRVDVWADISCPWCYIGRRHLSIALEQFERADLVDLVYRSYVLNPDAPSDFGGSAREFLVEHKDLSPEQVDQAAAQVSAAAASAGLVYDVGRLRVTNTFKVHQAVHVAEEAGRQLELVDRLFTAFFAEGRHLGRDGELADLAAEVGVDRGRVLEALESAEMAPSVRRDISRAVKLGVSGVPFVLVDGRLAVSGAQPPEVIMSLLQMGLEPVGSAD
jgi:predicted DsbA family dithiol-disulfide isomerase